MFQLPEFSLQKRPSTGCKPAGRKQETGIITPRKLAGGRKALEKSGACVCGSGGGGGAFFIVDENKDENPVYFQQGSFAVLTQERK